MLWLVITQRPSVEKNVGCFQQRLFVCLFVRLFVCRHDNYQSSKHRMMKLGGRCIVQKSWPSTNLGVIAPRFAPQKCGVGLGRWENQRSLSSYINTMLNVALISAVTRLWSFTSMKWCVWTHAGRKRNDLREKDVKKTRGVKPNWGELRKKSKQQNIYWYISSDLIVCAVEFVFLCITHLQWSHLTNSTNSHADSLTVYRRFCWTFFVLVRPNLFHWCLVFDVVW